MWRFIVPVCCLLIVFTATVVTKERTVCLQNDKTFFRNRTCAYLSDTHDWETAVRICSALDASETILDLVVFNSTLMAKYLKTNNVTALWVEVNQPIPNWPMMFRLPARSDTLEINRTELGYESYGVLWSKERPNGSCVLLTVDPVDGELRLHLENCSRQHPIMCLTPLVQKIESSNLLAKRNMLLKQILNQVLNSTAESTRPGAEPQLYLRHDSIDQIFLDVYHVERVQNNLMCYVDGASLLESDHKPKLELLNPFKWSTRMNDDIGYSITKNEYRVVTDQEGYVTCLAQVKGGIHFVRSEPLLHRTIYKLWEYSLAVRYPSYECFEVLCNRQRVREFLCDAGQTISKVMRSIVLEESTGNTHVNSSALFTSRLSPKCQESEFIGVFGEYISHLVPVKIDYRSKDGVLFIFRFSTFRDLTAQQLQTIRNVLRENSIDVVAIRSVDVCPAEGEWPATERGHSTLSDGPCRGAVRTCLGDFLEGAYWSRVQSVCEEFSERSDEIHQLSASSELADQQLTKLEAILTTGLHSGPLTASERKKISDILSQVKPENLSISDIATVVNITNTIMELSGEQLNVSSGAEDRLNSSNRILDSLESMLTRVKLEKDTELVVRSQFATLIVDMDTSQWSGPSAIRGIASKKTHNLLSQDVQQVSKSAGLQGVVNSRAELAVLLPDSLFNGSSGTRRLVMNVFASAALFVGGSASSLSPRNVLSVTVDGKRRVLKEDPLMLLFRKQYYQLNRDDTNTTDVPELGNPCVFWDFRGNDDRGVWSSAGCSLTQDEKYPAYDICVCTHLTNFAIFIGNSGKNYLEGSEPESLTYISILGCTLSIVGLCGIFVTAVALPQWRRRTGKKIQLNLSVALFLLMASFLGLAIVGERNMTREHCVATGALMHFSLLATYLWMLSIAWYQYGRLTAPLPSLNHAPHYLLYSAIGAWGAPLVLCSVLLAVDVNTYGLPSCYPVGDTLLLFVYVPVLSILVANTVIFFLILWSIFECKKCILQRKTDCQLDHNQKRSQRIMIRLMSSFYNFILLGLCWMFGFLGWQYLFCVTATLQGFSLFVFFVVLDKDTREKWRRLLERQQVNLRTLLGN